jgi:type IV secretory pathway VirJ component
MRLAPIHLSLALIASGAALGQSTANPALHTEREQFADLGAVEILHTNAAPADLLLLLDDKQGRGHDLAQQLALQGHWIAYLPVQNLLDNAAHHRDACIDASTLLDVFSQHVQEKYRFAHYQKPVLIGNGQAAGLAYTTLAQAPQRLFAAGIGIDFCPRVALPAPPCQAAGAPLADKIAAGTYRLRALAALNTPWQQLSTGHNTCAESTAPFGSTTTVASADLAAAIGKLSAPKTVSPKQGVIAVDDLALVELPAANSKEDFFVVLLSGDGGWADIDKDIGDQLNSAGIPVVGWNTLQYFWNRKTPEIAGADLQRVIAHYQQAWRKQRVMLIGFSLGADVLPFMVSRLPSAQRAQIADIALLSLSHTVDFEFHVSAWLGSSDGDTHQVAPELKKITEPVLCIYGSADDDTLCKDFKALNVTNLALPGDHHYEGDFQRATQAILQHFHNKAR